MAIEVPLIPAPGWILLYENQAEGCDAARLVVKRGVVHIEGFERRQDGETKHMPWGNDWEEGEDKTKRGLGGGGPRK